jgi:phytoene desaturase
MSQKVIVIGSGFAGLSAATVLTEKGYDVTLVEKNNSPGGRARSMVVDGFTFDMGPSWYWMPDVFDNYFERFGKKVSDYYQLERLDPSYTVYFEDGPFEVPAGLEAVISKFESIETGSGENLRAFMKEAQIKYEIGMGTFVHKPSHSILEFADWKMARDAVKLHLFKSFSSYVRKYFANPKLLELMEFPVLFLGAKPEKTPALYSLMNYADVVLGTWYPMGGMHKIVEGMVSLAKEKGVKFLFDAPVEKIEIEKGKAKGVWINNELHPADAIVAAADYHHVDQNLIDPQWRSYSKQYWDRRTMSPSSLLFYLGLDRKIPGLEHHNLFFDADFKGHAKTIYDTQEWPDNPLFYACCPSKTDPSVAPNGQENLFLLVPLAPDLDGDESTREKYFEMMINRMQMHLNTNIRDHVIIKQSYAHAEFISDYNAFKGNAYGLANTLEQTAFLKPKMKSKKVCNLLFAGQLTTPGPGVPPSLISGQVAAEETHKILQSTLLEPA